MVLTLYQVPSSPPVRSVKVVIEALGLKVEYLYHDVLELAHLKEDFVKINPQHTIPVLKDDDFYISDSHAIAVYLLTKYGRDDRQNLYPADHKKRAIINQRLHFDCGVLFAALKDTVVPVFMEGEEAPRPENLEKMIEGYEFTEKFLIKKTWLAGDEFTLADICCATTLTSMNEVLPIDEALYPNLTAWLERCYHVEIFKKINVPGVNKFRQLYKIAITTKKYIRI